MALTINNNLSNNFICRERYNLDGNLAIFNNHSYPASSYDKFFYLDLKDNKIKSESKSSSFFHKLDRIYNTITGKRDYNLSQIASHLVKDYNFSEQHFESLGYKNLIGLIVSPLKLTEAQKVIAGKILGTGEVNDVVLSKDYLKVQELILKQPNLLQLHQESSRRHQAHESNKFIASWQRQDTPPPYSEVKNFETDRYYYLDRKNNNEIKSEEKKPSFINSIKRFFYTVSGKRDYSFTNIAIATIRQTSIQERPTNTGLNTLINKIITRIPVDNNTKQYLVNYLTKGRPDATSIDKSLFIASKLILDRQTLNPIYENLKR